MILTRVSIILLTVYFASGKIYKRCELARELRNFDMAENEIPTWVCIAQHESNFDTAAMNYGSGDHGLFQISQLYWCSPPGDGYGCNSPCSKFRDDDIADDLQCIRRIFNEHKRISGDGFNAWVVYPLYCKGDNAKYVRDCYDGEPDIASNLTENEITTEEVDEDGDGYQFPTLPSFSGARDYGDGYQFPKLPYSEASINHSLPTKNFSAKRVSKIIKHKLHKVPYSKTSIHDAVLAESNGTYSKPPYSKISIHHAVPAKEKTLIKFPYSKESIHHFIPTNVVSSKPSVVDKQHLADELNNNTNASSSTRKNQVPSGTDAAPFTYFSHSSSTKKYESNNYLKAAFKAKNNAEKTTKKSPNDEKASTPSSMNKDVGKTAKTPSTTTTFSKSPTGSSQKSFLPHDIFSTTIQDSSSTTIKPPLASRKVFVTRAPTKVPLHATTPNALLQRAFFDLKSASSTFSPLRQIYASPSAAIIKSHAKSSLFTGLGSFSTSSMKPLTTPHYHLPEAATKVSTSSATTTPSRFSTIKQHIYNTIPTKSFRNYKHPPPSSTTIKPSAKQVTFAPDSFFSWLFSSQTLPPIVAPSRPLRPQGERPGPNLQRPGAPVGGPIQPMTTRRPFPLRPSAPRPIRPQQRPFAAATAAPRPPSYSSRKPLRPGADHSALVVFREDATEAPKQGGGSTEASEGRAVEIKLDNNFVFVRTKYGYRLFRV